MVSSTRMIPAVAPSPVGSAAPTARSSPLLTPLIPLHPITKDSLTMPSIPQSPPLGSHDVTPMPQHSRAQTTDGAQLPSSPHHTAKDTDYFTMRVRQAVAGASTSDDFSAWGGPGKHDSAALQTPLTPGGGLMGRLKNFGKVTAGKKGPGDVGSMSPVVGPILVPEDKVKVSMM